MKPYPKYKDSGIEWIGDIPEHWELKKIKYISELKSGENITSEKISIDGDYAVYGGNGIRGYFSSYTHEGNYVLIGRQGALCGNINYAYGKFWASEHAVVSKFKEKCELIWFGELLRSMNLNQYAISAAQPGLSVDTIKNLFIPAPPFNEQTAIAAFLDRKTAEIDSIIANKERLIELYEEEKAAVINHAVTKGLDPDAKMKDSCIEWLWEIPEHWEVKQIKYIAELKSGDGITSEQIVDNGKYPVYGGNGLRGYYDSYTHEGEYLLIGRQGALCGNINYTCGKFWASEHAIVVTSKRYYKLIWLGELLRVMNLNQYSVSAAQPGLSVDNIKKLFVPIPSVEEQTVIVQHIETKCGHIDAIISKFKRQIDLLKEYRTALISEAVTGKIDVRENMHN